MAIIGARPLAPKRQSAARWRWRHKDEPVQIGPRRHGTASPQHPEQLGIWMPVPVVDSHANEANSGGGFDIQRCALVGRTMVTHFDHIEGTERAVGSPESLLRAHRGHRERGN
jgi:hypothetical protein